MSIKQGTCFLGCFGKVWYAQATFHVKVGEDMPHLVLKTPFKLESLRKPNPEISCLETVDNPTEYIWVDFLNRTSCSVDTSGQNE